MSACNLLFIGCIAAAAVTCASCSTSGAKHTDISNISLEQEESGALLETECEAQLHYLTSRIRALGSNTAASSAASTRLKELHSMSEELYLKREYALALTLIEEALQLIEEFGD